MNDENAQSCSFCGYIFEDFATGGVGSGLPAKSGSEATIQNNLNTLPTVPDQSSIPSTTSSVPTGATLFVVTRSLLGTILPALVYLFLIFTVGVYSGFSVISLILVVLFLIIAVIPSLFTPRRFEFSDSSLKIHKIIGGDSEIPYSDLTMLDYPVRGRAQQIVLSMAGQRRPIIISKNPKNESLGIDLRQFLTSKLKKPDTGSTIGNPSNSASTDSGDVGNENQPSL